MYIHAEREREVVTLHFIQHISKSTSCISKERDRRKVQVQGEEETRQICRTNKINWLESLLLLAIEPQDQTVCFSKKYTILFFLLLFADLH